MDAVDHGDEHWNDPEHAVASHDHPDDKGTDEGSDDSEEDSSDSEMEREDESSTKLLELQDQIAANPVQYDLHVQYIALLRKTGQLQKLRNAREKMSLAFPLTPEMWMEWIQDETRLISSEKEAAFVESLYKKGVQDYLSVDLWESYTDFVWNNEYETVMYKVEENEENKYKNDKWIKKVRSIFENALTFCGIHFFEGHKIWKKFRSFEMEVYSVLNQDELQLDKIRSLYQRQLSIPHSNYQNTMKEYYQWEKKYGNKIERKNNGTDVNDDTDCDGIDDFYESLPKHFKFSQKKALSLCEERERMENRLSSLPSNSEECYDAYLEYIDLEKKTNEAPRIQCIFERAICLFPLYSQLWIDYASYVDEFLKVHNVIKNVYSRALRNCPWIFQLWFNYLLALERSKSSQAEISRAFEQSLVGGMQNADEYVEIFLVYIDILRREYEFSAGDGDDNINKYNDNNTDDKQKNKIQTIMRSLYQRAENILETYFLEHFDYFLKIFCYLANLEVRLFNNHANAIDIWQNLTKKYGHIAKVWKCYIDFEMKNEKTKSEIAHDDTNNDKVNNALGKVRSLYKISYLKNFDGFEVQDICNDWIKFERERGTLQDYDYAIMKVKKRLEEIQASIAPMQQNQEIEIKEEKRRIGSKGDKKSKTIPRMAQKSDAVSRGQKFHTNPKAPSEQQIQDMAEGKKRKRDLRNLEQVSEKEAKKSKANIAVCGNAEDSEHHDVQKGPMEEKVVADSEMESRLRDGSQINEMKDGEENEKGEMREERREREGEGEREKKKEGKRKKNELPSVVYTDICTAFVSSLPLNVTEESLKEFFLPCGNLKDVRFGRDRISGKFKGFAYVEFGDEQSLNKALEMNKLRIQGRPICVQKSDPRAASLKKINKATSSYSSQGRLGRGSEEGKRQRPQLGGEQVIGKRETRRPGIGLEKVPPATFAAPRAVSKPIARPAMRPPGRHVRLDTKPPTATFTKCCEPSEPERLASTDDSSQPTRVASIAKESGSEELSGASDLVSRDVAEPDDAPLPSNRAFRDLFFGK